MCTKLKNPHVVRESLGTDTINELYHMSMSNSTALGAFIGLACKKIFNLTQFTPEVLATVSVSFADIEELTKEVSCGQGYEATRSDWYSSRTTRSEGFFTLYGMKFNANVSIRLTSRGSPVHEFTFDQSFHVVPASRHRIPPPVNQGPVEFDIGALLHIAFDCTQVTHVTKSTIRGWEEVFAMHTPTDYPVHNIAVKKIRKAVKNFGRMVDFITAALVGWTTFAQDTRNITVPWGIYQPRVDQETYIATKIRDLKTDGEESSIVEDDTTVVLSEDLLSVLHTFWIDCTSRFSENDSTISVLLQTLMVVKLVITHMDAVWSSIEHTMVEAFYDALGPTDSAPWKQGLPLNGIINDILTAILQSPKTPNPVKLKEMSYVLHGCSLQVEQKLPGGKSFQPLRTTIVKEKTMSPDEGYTIAVGGEGKKVHGKMYTHVAFTAVNGSSAKPVEWRLAGSSAYGVQIVIVAGSLIGNSNTADAVFELGDARCLEYAINVACTPSNEVFRASKAMLPHGVQHFLDMYRAAAITKSMIVFDVLTYRPALAAGLGKDVSLFDGNRKLEQQLVNLMRAGASLNAIRAGKDDSIEKIIASTEEYSNQTYQVGQEHHRKRHKSSSAEPNSFGMYSSLGVEQEPYPYASRSLGAAQEPDPYVTRSLGAAQEVNRDLRVEGGAADPGEQAPEGESDDEYDTVLKEDPNLVESLLNRLDGKVPGKSFSAAKLSFTNMSSGLRVASNYIAEKPGEFCESAKEDDWGPIGSAGKVQHTTLVENLIKPATEPIQVTRVVLAGLLLNVPHNIIEHCINGGENPLASCVSAVQVARDVLDGMK